MEIEANSHLVIQDICFLPDHPMLEMTRTDEGATSGSPHPFSGLQ